MLGSGLNLVTTVIGFGMSATFIVFICARLICGRIRRSESRAAAFDLELRPDLDPPEHAIRGLDSVDVAAIPTMKYRHKAFHSKEDAQCSICSICLGEYEDKEVLRIMPACLHNFHLTCIDLWLQNNSTCPICRLPLNAIHEARLAFSFANDHFNAWALPTHQHTESSGSNQEISGAVSVVIGIPHGEHESGT